MISDIFDCQFCEGAVSQMYSENLLQINRRAPMLKCDFNNYNWVNNHTQTYFKSKICIKIVSNVDQ